MRDHRRQNGICQQYPGWGFEHAQTIGFLAVKPVHDRLGREIPQEPPVEQSLELDCVKDVEPPLDLALNVDSLRFTLVLPQEGQATLSALPL